MASESGRGMQFERIKVKNTGRRTGMTTKLVDQAIQLLFDDKTVLVEDHHDTRKSHCCLLALIKTRLRNEHRADYSVREDAHGNIYISLRKQYGNITHILRYKK